MKQSIEVEALIKLLNAAGKCGVTCEELAESLNKITGQVGLSASEVAENMRLKLDELNS
jgi:hypothetical protein